MGTADRIPEYLYTQDDINFILQENKKLKESAKTYKRYWLFEIPQYYPNGGMADFKGDFDSIEEAEDSRNPRFDSSISWQDVLAKGTSKERDERDTGYHIFDTQDRKIVAGWNPFWKIKVWSESLEKINEEF